MALPNHHTHPHLSLSCCTCMTTWLLPPQGSQRSIRSQSHEYCNDTPLRGLDCSHQASTATCACTERVASTLATRGWQRPSDRRLALLRRHRKALGCRCGVTDRLRRRSRQRASAAGPRIVTACDALQAMQLPSSLTHLLCDRPEVRQCGRWRVGGMSARPNVPTKNVSLLVAESMEYGLKRARGCPGHACVDETDMRWERDGGCLYGCLRICICPCMPPPQ